MEQNQIKSLINMLGFTPKNNQQNIYCKIYPTFDYEINIDFNTKQIIYPAPLRLGDKTTSNFGTDENFVVLECVDRLLSQGYDPHYIELSYDAIFNQYELDKKYLPLSFLGELFDNALVIPNPENVDMKKVNSVDFDYIDIASVENYTGKIIDVKRTLFAKAPSRAKRLVAQNDVLFSTVRPNLKAFAKVPKLNYLTIVSTGFCVLRCTDTILPDFLLLCLNSEFMIEQMIGLMPKQQYPSLNLEEIRRLKIPLPPLPTQQKIVEDIETQRKIIEDNKQKIDALNQKKQDIMNELWSDDLA